MSPRRVAGVLLLVVLLVVQASAEVDSVSVKEDEKYDLEQNVSDLGQTGWLTRHLRALGFDVFGKSHRESSRGDFDASQPDSNPQLSVRRTLQSSSQKKTPSTSAKKRPPPPKTKKTSSSPKKKSPPPKTKKKQSPPPKTKKKQPPPPKTNTLSPPKKKSPPPPKKKSPPPPKKKKQPPPRQLSSLPTGSSSARASAGSEKVKVQVEDVVVLDANMPPRRETLDLGDPGRSVVPARQTVVVPGRVVVHD